MRMVILFLFLIQMQATASAKSLGMYDPKFMYLNLHSKHPDKCEAKQDDSLRTHSFVVELQCAYRCKKDLLNHAVSLSRKFDPDDHGLKRGNGYVPDKIPMMTSFTTVFFNWSTQECLEEGVRQCGSIEEVKSADFKSLKSGTWSISEKPTCQQNKRVVYSPFDRRYKLNTQNPSNDPNKSLPTSPVSLVKIPVGSPIDSSNQKSNPCNFIISGTICFGDCILLDESQPYHPITMMTKESNVTNGAVCGDSLVQAFQGKVLSESVADSICQNFFMNSLVKSGIEGTTCSAFRGQADCKSFVKKVSK
jgi:hypothetical protein